jgi:hypothetical protein
VGGVRRAARLRSRRNDSGATIIEVVVAIALLGVFVTPAVRLIITTSASANADRLRIEAATLATNDLESIQNIASFGNLDTETLPPPVQQVTENYAPAHGTPTVDSFTVTTGVQLETAGGSSICTASAAPQIYRIWAEVQFKGDNNAPVYETTYIAPEQGGQVPLNEGELAVPVDTTVLTPETAVSVPVTIVGTLTGNPTILQTVQSGTGSSGGCAVFPNLNPAYGWEIYLGTGTDVSGTVTITPPSNAVTNNELSGIVNQSVVTAGSFSETAPVLVIGSTVASSALIVNVPDVVGIGYETMTCTTVILCTQAVVPGVPPTNVTAASPIPVTVAASELGANTTFSFDTATSGNAPISSVSLYPYTDYTMWAGDTSDSNPGYQGGTAYPGDSPTVLGSNASETLPVYDVVLDTGATAPPAGVNLTATQYLPPADPALALGAYTGTLHTSYTGLPLGEFSLGATSGYTVIPEFIWVTPTAVYYGNGPATTPTSFTKSAASGTAIEVTLTP